MQLRIAPIVKGHGEVASIRLLLQRIDADLLGGVGIDIRRPIRIPRTRVEHHDDLYRMIDLASLDLRSAPDPVASSFVLLLLDTDPDPRPACAVAPDLLRRIGERRSHLDVACVLAHPEWETWFVAAARSLVAHLDLPEDLPEDPESSRSAKGWVKQHFRGHYSETVDQPKLTSRMDLHLCRERSPSFDKLCREIEKRLPDRSTR